MNSIGDNIRIQYLNHLKSIVSNNKCKFIIVNRPKNITFLKENNLSYADVINIIMNLTLKDFLAGPEEDREEKFVGWIFKFCPFYGSQKLYIKVRVEDKTKAVCISIHEFGLYEGDD